MEGRPAEDRLGTVRISPQVLATIAKLTALSVPGVVRMHRDVSSGVDRFLHGKRATDGVRIEVVDDAVSVDIYLVADQQVNLYDLGREIQTRVSRAIKDMVGMPVLAVNVHVEDVLIGPQAD
ncbi:MAG: Asp23/Gls24 family envelope stress response protein [Anaerolineae bacterium]